MNIEEFHFEDLTAYKKRLLITLLQIRLAQHTGPLTLEILQRYIAESYQQMQGFFGRIWRLWQESFIVPSRGEKRSSILYAVGFFIFQLIIVVDIQKLSRSLFIRMESVFLDMILRKQNMSVTAVRWRKELQIKVETLQTRYGDVSTFPEVFEQFRQELTEIARICGEYKGLLPLFEVGRVDLEPQIEAKIKPYSQSQTFDSGGCSFCKSPWFETDNEMEKDFMEQKCFQNSEDLRKFFVWTFQKTFSQSLLDFFVPIFPKI